MKKSAYNKLEWEAIIGPRGISSRCWLYHAHIIDDINLLRCWKFNRNKVLCRSDEYVLEGLGSLQEACRAVVPNGTDLLWRLYNHLRAIIYPQYGLDRRDRLLIDLYILFRIREPYKTLELSQKLAYLATALKRGWAELTAENTLELKLRPKQSGAVKLQKTFDWLKNYSGK